MCERCRARVPGGMGETQFVTTYGAMLEELVAAFDAGLRAAGSELEHGGPEFCEAFRAFGERRKAEHVARELGEQGRLS